MATLRYRTKIEFGVTAAIFVIAGFFAILAWDIDPSSDEAIGPRFVPMFIAVTMLVLGALISVNAMRNNDNRSAPASPGGEMIPIEVYEEDDFGFRDADVRRVFWVIGCGILYIALFAALGYFLSTLIGLALIMMAFGNRNPVALIGYPLAGAVVYQYIFMGLMGLHDPAGDLIDFTAVSGLISGN